MSAKHILLTKLAFWYVCQTLITLKKNYYKYQTFGYSHGREEKQLQGWFQDYAPSSLSLCPSLPVCHHLPPPLLPCPPIYPALLQAPSLPPSPHTFSGVITQPLQAMVMKLSVSVSGRRPKAAVGSGGPPTCTTQQLMLWPRIMFTLLWRRLGEENPQMPSVSRMRPVCACIVRVTMSEQEWRTSVSTLSLMHSILWNWCCLVSHTFEAVSRQKLQGQCSCLDHSLKTVVSLAVIVLDRYFHCISTNSASPVTVQKLY